MRRLGKIACVVALVVAESAAHAADCGKGEWTVLPDMSIARFFPVALLLPDGNAMVVGGPATR